VDRTGSVFVANRRMNVESRIRRRRSRIKMGPSTSEPRGRIKPELNRSYWLIEFREILLWRNSSGFVRRLMFGSRTSIPYTSNEELPVGMCFALLVTSPLVTRPFHNLPNGKRAHNLLQHARWVTLVPVGGYFPVFTLVTRPTGNASSYLIQKAI
jgi:hypothetical protein